MYEKALSALALTNTDRTTQWILQIDGNICNFLPFDASLHLHLGPLCWSRWQFCVIELTCVWGCFDLADDFFSNSSSNPKDFGELRASYMQLQTIDESGVEVAPGNSRQSNLRSFQSEPFLPLAVKEKQSLLQWLALLLWLTPWMAVPHSSWLPAHCLSLQCMPALLFLFVSLQQDVKKKTQADKQNSAVITVILMYEIFLCWEKEWLIECLFLHEFDSHFHVNFLHQTGTESTVLSYFTLLPLGLLSCLFWT